MSEAAANLVDRVLPRAPVRQWVLSMPYRVRYHLAGKPALVREALKIFIDEIFAGLRRRSGERRAKAGSVTVVQRFGSALNLNVHFHSVVLDGVFVRGEFREAAPPTQEELAAMAARVRGKILAMLVRRGAIADPDSGIDQRDEPAEEPELFDVLRAASIRGWIGMAPGFEPVEMIGKKEEWLAVPGPLCAAADGFSIHANVRIEADDRAGLEQLCRYVLRPPFAADRFALLPDGRVVYGLRRRLSSRRWRRQDGATHMILRPGELLEKLAALVPPPRGHLVRYHGILAPNSRDRWRVVPTPAEPPVDSCEAADRSPDALQRRIDWATLMKRTFGLDVLACPDCGGRMKLIACIEEPDVIEKILRSMGRETEPPALAPARSPPESDLPWSEAV